MNTTTYEKAKAYEYVSQKVKDFFEGKQKMYSDVKQTLEYLFPELAENEDEKIRKELIRLLNVMTDGIVENYTTTPLRDFIAWLDKQGETYTKKDVDDAYLKGICDAKRELEKQGEQKPVNSYCQENCKGFQETGKCYTDSECKAKKDAEQNPAWSEDDEKMMQCIHKYVKASASNFDYDNIQIWFRNLKKRVQPQQKQQWSEEDEKIRKELIDRFKSLKPYFSWYEVPIDSILAWLEKQGSAHFAWSEEDKKHLERAIYMMEQLNMTKSWDDVYNWLKSLKPQPHWKPTEEQIHCFKCVIDFYKTKVNDTIVLNLLDSLYNNLLKL